MRKILKKVLLINFVAILLFAFMPTAFSHSGRTDGKGGHKDNYNASGLGYYHYHCGGNPPHLHENGVCPYKTNTSTSKSSGSKSQIASIQGAVDATDIELIADETVIYVDEQIYISAIVKPDTTTNKTVYWNSSNDKIASIVKDSNEKILVTGKGAGGVTITAETYSGVKASVRITVKARENSLANEYDFWDGLYTKNLAGILVVSVAIRLIRKDS